jgi:hypothetical protein
MTGPENVTPDICNARGRLAFAKVMERIVKEIEGHNPDSVLLTALAACGEAACAEFEGD